nr:hypothetical protein [Propionibacterium sp.]
MPPTSSLSRGGPDPRRPAGMLLAAGLTGLFAAGMVVMGVLSVASHPNPITFGIGAVLWLWAAVLAWAARGMALGRRWSRGPVVAAGLLHLASFANFVPSQPLAALPAALAAVTVAGALWPSTTAALRFGRAAED